MPEPISAELRQLLTLHLVPGLGPRLTAALLARFGSAEAILRAAPEELQAVPHIGPKLAQDFHRAIREADVQAETALIAQHGVRLLALGGAGYPAPLVRIPDPPPLLYVKGSLEPQDAKAVALVGSRQCTTYGRRMVERLATGLVHAGFTIVSGLARGIDGAAHRAALQAGGRTIAVLAGGLAGIYPPEHAELAEQILGSGALLSESPMGFEPMAAMFPARNRIISGLARAVVIVEAAERSGALITASHAAEQGREVFAVPGPADSLASAGALKLLRHGARLVRSADDILEDLEGIAPLVAPATSLSSAEEADPSKEPPPGLDDTQRSIWDFLVEQPQHVDDLARQLGLAIPDLARALMMLEMKRIVRRLPGNRYERC